MWHDDGDAAIKCIYGGFIVMADIDRKADIDNRRLVVVSEAVQEHSTFIVICAAEDDIAGPEGVATGRVTDPTFDRDDSNSKAAGCHTIGNHFDLWT